MNEPLGDREVLVHQPVHALRRRAQGQPALLRRRRAARARRAALRALLGAARRPARRLRRPHGCRARQRRAGDPAARASSLPAPCRLSPDSSSASPPSHRRRACPTAAGPSSCTPSSWPRACASTPRARSSASPARSRGSPTAASAAAPTSPPPRARAPASSSTATSRSRATTDGEPTDFAASADFTGETAEANPDWAIDLSDEVVGAWRGEHGAVAAMTLIWGVPLVPRRSGRHRRARGPRRRPVHADRGALHAARARRLPRRHARREAVRRPRQRARERVALRGR